MRLGPWLRLRVTVRQRVASRIQITQYPALSTQPWNGGLDGMALGQTLGVQSHRDLPYFIVTARLEGNSRGLGPERHGNGHGNYIAHKDPMPTDKVVSTQWISAVVHRRYSPTAS